MDEDLQLSKKERRAQKHLERDKEFAQRVLKKRAKRAFFWVLVACFVLSILGAMWYLWQALRGPGGALATLGKDYSREIPFVGQDHIPEGARVTNYNSNPPTSGDHWVDPQLDGVYDKVIPDEAMVHSLEHGRIWISYKPSIPESVKEALRRIGRSQTFVLVTERPANDTDIAVAAWQRLDTFNIENGRVDEKRIYDFIMRYRNKGPENVPLMTGKQY